MAGFGVSNALGLLALASLLPLILLFFIRPKPKEVSIPSLMFWDKSPEFKSKSGLLRHFFHDKLLVFQMLILVLLSLFFASPYLSYAGATSEEVIMVLDASASLALDDLFSEAEDEALNRLGTINSVIVVGSTPRLIADKVDRGDAREKIRALEVLDGRSSLTESILFAEELFNEASADASIVVISDFKETEGGNVNEVIKDLQEKDIPLVLVPLVSESQKNIGIVSVTLSKKRSSALIHNYCCEEQDVKIRYGDDEALLTIPEGESTPYSFSLAEGESKLELLIEDDFSLDNTLDLLQPTEETINVALVTSQTSEHLEAALKASSDVNLEIVLPSGLNKDYDVYVLHNVESLSSSAVSHLTDALKAGKNIIIHAEEGMRGNYNGLWPHEISGLTRGGEIREQEQAAFTNNLAFGRVTTLPEINCGEECGTIYFGTEEQPVVMITAKEKGVIAYYGLLEEESGFKGTPDYPIFWIRLVKYLGSFRGLNSVNLQTGTILSFPNEVDIKTPSGARTKTTIFALDEQGKYEIDGKPYTANLLSKTESDTTINVDILSSETSESSTAESTKRPIWREILLIGTLFLFLEWFFIHSRLRRKQYYG